MQIKKLNYNLNLKAILKNFLPEFMIIVFQILPILKREAVLITFPKL